MDEKADSLTYSRYPYQIDPYVCKTYLIHRPNPWNLRGIIACLYYACNILIMYNFKLKRVLDILIFT